MKRQYLMPSAMGVVLMLCLLTVQASILRGMSQSSAGPGMRTDYTYGVPTMLRISDAMSDDNGTRSHSVHVYWARIAIVLAVAWCLSMPIGRWITGYTRRDGEFVGPRRTGRSHPATIIGYVLAGCAIVGAVVGALVSQVESPVPLPEMIFGFFIMLMILAVPATVIVMIVRRWRYRSRIGQRGFAVEIPAAQV
jgi:hypothetical protein